MNCVRCGKETEGKSVFCPECLEDMEHYPVKPGTIVHIPHRPDPDTRKPAKKKREYTVEEQLKKATDLIQFLIVLLLGLFGTLVITGVLLFYTLTHTIDQPQPEETQPPAGRNYTITSPAEE